LGFDPKMDVVCRNGITRVQSGEAITQYTQDPNQVLRDILSGYTPPKMEGLPPFTGGFVGFFSYDYFKYNEKSLKLTQKDPVGFDDMHLMLFDRVIVFDHVRQKISIIINIKMDDLEANYTAATEELRQTAQIILEPGAGACEPSGLRSDFKPLFSKEKYCRMVEETKKHIYEGDIFQAVVSNRLEAEYQGSLLNAYRILRTVNPSPYMFYLCFDDLEIAGASPETLLSLADGALTTFPIAGTCPRGRTEEEDAAFIRQLLQDKKELSEHNMLVDLGRNDLGRISEFGSVHVTDYQKVLKFSHVSHITSTVTGKLKKGLDAINAISAVLPAGTLSGAPKIRACEIINKLEGTKRGVYGGAIGYIGFSGNLDMCIAIRMACKTGNKVYVQAGAGIVADSVPEKEFEECIRKATAMTKALQETGEVE
ncbi:MAG: anthranilate synthase component I family protein, partial [Eubacteriales bacterium]